MSPAEIHRFLLDASWSLDEQLTHERSTINLSRLVYRHIDGRVMSFIPDKAGYLYESQRDFDLVFRPELTSTGENIDDLEVRTEERQDFVDQVPQLIATLPALIEISKEDLDYSLDSLAKVEEAVNRTGRSKSLQSPLFEALVAYVGEVMRQAANGVWETRKSERIWVSWVSISERAYCDPIDLVYDVFERSSTNAEYALQDAVRGELSIGRLKPGARKSTGADVIRKTDG
jgi:hypothetical protein